MAIFKIVVNDPKSRKSVQKDVEQDDVVGIIGKKIGDEFNGDLIGFDGYTLQITGGTDKDGFPMHPDLNGTMRRKLLLTEKPGYRPDSKGKRRRKMVAGNTIGDSIVQINVKVVEEGKKSFGELTGKQDAVQSDVKEETEKEERVVEEKTEEKPEDKPEDKKEEKEESQPEEKKEENDEGGEKSSS